MTNDQRGNRFGPEEQISRSREALIWLGRVMLSGAGILVVFAASSLFPWEGGSAARFGRNLSIGLLLGGAAALVGALIGFLFGVPRTLQETTDTETTRTTGTDTAARKNEAKYRPNTNLEQISDWLTKILVGVGLTQLTDLPGHLQSLASYSAAGFAGLPRPQILAGSLIVYYAICGFIFTYLWARLFLGGELAEADLRLAVQNVDRKVNELEAQAARDARALALVQQQLNPQGAENEVGAETLADAVAKASPAVRTALLNQAWDVRKKTWQNDKPTMERTIPILQALAERERIDHMPHAQLGFALKDKRQPDWAAARESISRAIAFRGDWRENGWLIYEWNRAYCDIQIDLAKQRSAPTPKEELESIVADLQAAFHAEALVEWTRQEDTVLSWLAKNDITIEELIPSQR